MIQSIVRRRISILIVALVIAPLCCYFLIPDRRVEKELLKHQSVTLVVTKKNKTEDVVKTLVKDKPRLLQTTVEATKQIETQDVITDKVEGRLPPSVISGVKTLVFFLATSHSGHSIVASLMDSHPHMVISHEFDLFNKLASGSLTPTKSEIFNGLWENTRETIVNGLRAKNATRKGYTLFMDGLYQGRYVDHIDVIGDKRGLATIEMLLEEPDKWLRALDILKSLNMTLKMINVIRNPYDNIATAVLFISKIRSIGFGDIKMANKTREVNSKIIMTEISHHFSRHEATVNAKKKYNLDTIEIHSKDLISDPKGTLLRICNSLAVTCSDDYLEICSSKIFKMESRTRQLVQWTEEQLQTIQQNIDMYSNLKGYSFHSS